MCPIIIQRESAISADKWHKRKKVDDTFADGCNTMHMRQWYWKLQTNAVID